MPWYILADRTEPRILIGKYRSRAGWSSCLHSRPLTFYPGHRTAFITDEMERFMQDSCWYAQLSTGWLEDFDVRHLILYMKLANSSNPQLSAGPTEAGGDPAWYQVTSNHFKRLYDCIYSTMTVLARSGSYSGAAPLTTWLDFSRRCTSLSTQV